MGKTTPKCTKLTSHHPTHNAPTGTYKGHGWALKRIGTSTHGRRKYAKDQFWAQVQPLKNSKNHVDTVISWDVWIQQDIVYIYCKRYAFRFNLVDFQASSPLPNSSSLNVLRQYGYLKSKRISNNSGKLLLKHPNKSERKPPCNPLTLARLRTHWKNCKKCLHNWDWIS